MDTQKARILVVGGTGFLGKTLVPMLMKSGYEVFLLNRGSHLIPGTHQLTCDRNLFNDMSQAVSECPHFRSVIDLSPYTQRQTEDALRALAGKYDHWIHISSAAVYKETDSTALDEDSPLGGAEIWGEYGIDKSLAEQILNSQSYIRSLTVLRPPYIYGPNNDSDRETFVWKRLLRGRPIVIPGRGTTKIQFIHVEDLSSLILNLVELGTKGTGVYNVANSESVTLVEWIQMLGKVCGIEPDIILEDGKFDINPQKYFPFRDTPMILSTARLTKEIGWTPEIRPDKGFSQTFSCYSSQDLATQDIDTTIEEFIIKKFKDV